MWLLEFLAWMGQLGKLAGLTRHALFGTPNHRCRAAAGAAGVSYITPHSEN